MGKRRFISFKVDEDIADAANSPLLGSVREPWRVRCGRCIRFTGFCLVCTGTLFQALAPWMLSLIEVVSLLLILLLLTHRLPGPYECHFESCLDDVVLVGGLQAAVLSGTYAWGSRSNRLRPDLVTSYVVGVLGFTFALVKALYYKFTALWIPAAAMMATLAFYSCIQVLAARNTVIWAKRRASLGLAPLEGLGSIRFNGFSSSTGSLADLTDGASVVDIRQPLFNGEDGGATIVGRQALTVPHSQSMVDERVLMRCNEGYDRPGVQDQPVALGREGQGASTQMNGASEIVVAMPHQATR